MSCLGAQVLDLLLKAGADVNAIGFVGEVKQSVLHLFIRTAEDDGKRCCNVLKLILKAGADMKQKNQANATPDEAAELVSKPKLASMVKDFRRKAEKKESKSQKKKR